MITLVTSVDNSAVLNLLWKDFGASLMIGEAAPSTFFDEMYPNIWILPGDLKEDALPSTVPSSLLLTWLAIDPDSLPLSGDPAISETLNGVPTLRSDQTGWLRLTTDGQQVWFSSQKAVR